MKVSTTSKRLQQIMSERGLKQVDLLSLTEPYCKEYGIKMNKSNISQYVNGVVVPQQDKLFVLGIALNVSEGWLMGFDVPMERPTDAERFNAWVQKYNATHYSDQIVPATTDTYELLGEIACGEPIIANREYEVFSNGRRINADAVVKAHGDSMIDARIHDGDIVFVKYQEEVENGEIAAVILESVGSDDSEVVLKRFYKYGNDLIVLRSANPAYKDIEIHASDHRTVRILGKAVAFQSELI